MTAAWCGCWSACLKRDSNSMSQYTNLTHMTRIENGHNTGTRGIVAGVILLLIACVTAGGCAAKGKNARPAKTAATAAPAAPQVILDSGYQALEAQQYNEA